MRSVSKKNAVLFAGMLAAGCTFSGCSGDFADAASVTARSSKQSAEEIAAETAEPLTFPLTLKAGISTSADDPRGIALLQMAEEVKEATDGNILIELYADGELGSDNDLIAGLLTEEVDLTVSSAGNYSIYATRIGCSALPFLFEDFESAWDFIDSDTMKELCGELEPYNMHVLAFFDNGFRCVTTTDRKTETVSDMEGLVIRTPENQILMETMSALGTTPKSYPFTQLKDALKDGSFDAQENPIPVIYNSGLYEVQHYLAITNHSYDAMPLTIRSDIWERLPEEYRTALAEAALDAQAADRLMVYEQTTDYLSLLEDEGMEIIRPDTAEFAEATGGVIRVFSDVYGTDLLNTLNEL